MKQDTDRVVARFAAPPVTGVSEGARALMHEIMTNEPAPAPVRARRLPSLRLAIPAGALLAGGAVAVTWLLPASPAAALDIKEENGYYVIEVKDLYANPKIYEEQLRAASLDITLRVIPATAAFEGQVFPTSPDNQYLTEIKGIYPPGPCERVDGCAIGVKIPMNFKGTANIDVSRKARPGEKYESTTSFAAKGEPMHCVPYRNKTVPEVRALLKERGVRVSEYVDGDLVGKDDGSGIMSSAPDTWRVFGGALSEPGVATLFVLEKPEAEEKIAMFNKKYQQMNGCSVS
ncbi:hypothetical protein SAMN05444920_121133 [Nonomuraea solani]|uniref:PASTA domain-containing protein n=1 Tax=Nonomuraea solani TaxID=1144553 RepID=A0A1H6EXM7_9ACTN|nr:hypothetical protein [Nonomuraea solani]SEH01685.1 hypothetical protein SAMN05444920_121133 [Nonomuraea solani]